MIIPQQLLLSLLLPLESPPSLPSHSVAGRSADKGCTQRSSSACQMLSQHSVGSAKKHSAVPSGPLMPWQRAEGSSGRGQSGAARERKGRENGRRGRMGREQQFGLGKKA